MITTRLDTLRSDVRFRLDYESTSDRLSDSQLNRAINRAKNRLAGLVLKGTGDGYWSLIDGVELPAGSHYIDLSTDLNNSVSFHSLIKLSWMESYTLNGSVAVATGRMYPMQRVSIDDHFDGIEADAQGWNSGYLPRYRLVDRRIYFEFYSPNSEGLQIHHTYVPADLSADSDTLKHQPGWDEWVVLDAAIQIAQRDGVDATQWIRDREMLREQILRELQDRDEWGTPTIRSTFDRTPGDPQIYDIYTRWF